MSSRPIDKFRRNTAVNLTLRFALIFFLCSSALFVTVDFLLARAQLQKDQQLVSSFLESYERLEQDAGLHKLELVIARDAPFFQRSEMRVELFDQNGNSLLTIQPENWRSKTLVGGAEHSRDDEWYEAVFTDGSKRVLMRQSRLSDGSRISIGMSTAPREAELADSRALVLSVMVPLLCLGLLLTAYINWRALRPVHDLIDTVRSIKATDLKTRVRVRDPHSELGELAHLFNQMLSHIEQLITGMQHSLDAVAHDIRTPLARMRLSIESALSNPDEDALREALLDCAEESERIETMLRVLMDISEAESGILSLHPEPIDMQALVIETIDMYSHVAEDKGISLNIEGDETVNLVADRVRLRQVLGNLLDNAIKYSDPGRDIAIGWQKADGTVLLNVTDQGCGISPLDQNRVFDRLYRADKSRSEAGMGLGLSLVKAVVEAHRGTISLTSEPGQGSQFRVSLPIIAGAA